MTSTRRCRAEDAVSCVTRTTPGVHQDGKARVKAITRRTGGRSITSRRHELRRYFQRWLGYFPLGLSQTQLRNLDEWVRRRIRACYWKQWRRTRTRMRMLPKLGVRRDQAISHGSSGRGPWVMSSSAARHVPLSTDSHTRQGLASLEAIWRTFASKKRTASCGPACYVVWEGLRSNPGPYPDLWFVSRGVQSEAAFRLPPANGESYRDRLRISNFCPATSSSVSDRPSASLGAL